MNTLGRWTDGEYEVKCTFGFSSSLRFNLKAGFYASIKSYHY